MFSHNNSFISYGNMCLLIAGMLISSCDESAFLPLGQFEKNTRTYEVPVSESEDESTKNSPGKPDESADTHALEKYWKQKYFEAKSQVSFLQNILENTSKEPFEMVKGPVISFGHFDEHRTTEKPSKPVNVQSSLGGRSGVVATEMLDIHTTGQGDPQAAVIDERTSVGAVVQETSPLIYERGAVVGHVPDPVRLELVRGEVLSEEISPPTLELVVGEVISESARNESAQFQEETRLSSDSENQGQNLEMISGPLLSYNLDPIIARLNRELTSDIRISGVRLQTTPWMRLRGQSGPGSFLAEAGQNELRHQPLREFSLVFGPIISLDPEIQEPDAWVLETGPVNGQNSAEPELTLEFSGVTHVDPIEHEFVSDRGPVLSQPQRRPVADLSVQVSENVSLSDQSREETFQAERSGVISVEREASGLTYAIGPVVTVAPDQRGLNWVRLSGPVEGQMPTVTELEFSYERSEVFGQNTMVQSFVSEQGCTMGQSRRVPELESVRSVVTGHQPTTEPFEMVRGAPISQNCEETELVYERGPILGQGRETSGLELVGSGVSGYQPDPVRLVSERGPLLGESRISDQTQLSIHVSEGISVGGPQPVQEFMEERTEVVERLPEQQRLQQSRGPVLTLVPETPEINFEAESGGIISMERVCLPFEMVTGPLLSLPATHIRVCLERSVNSDISIPQVLRVLEEEILPGVSVDSQMNPLGFQSERGSLISVERTISDLSLVIGPVTEVRQERRDLTWSGVIGGDQGQMTEQILPDLSYERSEIYGQNLPSSEFVSERGMVIGQPRISALLELEYSGVSGYQPARNNFESARGEVFGQDREVTGLVLEYSGVSGVSSDLVVFESMQGEVVGQEREITGLEMEHSGVSGYQPVSEDFVFARGPLLSQPLTLARSELSIQTSEGISIPGRIVQPFEDTRSGLISREPMTTKPNSVSLEVHTEQVVSLMPTAPLLVLETGPVISQEAAIPSDDFELVRGEVCSQDLIREDRHEDEYRELWDKLVPMAEDLIHWVRQDSSLSGQMLMAEWFDDGDETLPENIEDLISEFLGEIFNQMGRLKEDLSVNEHQNSVDEPEELLQRISLLEEKLNSTEKQLEDTERVNARLNRIISFQDSGFRGFAEDSERTLIELREENKSLKDRIIEYQLYKDNVPLELEKIKASYDFEIKEFGQIVLSLKEELKQAIERISSREYEIQELKVAIRDKNSEIQAENEALTKSEESLEILRTEMFDQRKFYENQLVEAYGQKRDIQSELDEANLGLSLRDSYISFMFSKFKYSWLSLFSFNGRFVAELLSDHTSLEQTEFTQTFLLKQKAYLESAQYLFESEVLGRTEFTEQPDRIWEDYFGQKVSDLLMSTNQLKGFEGWGGAVSNVISNLSEPETDD